MSFIHKILRSLIPGAQPTGGSAEEGELYANLPDHRLGIIDQFGDPIDLIAVTHHSDQAEYDLNDLVQEAGAIYRCVVAHTAKVFDQGDWVSIGVAVGTALAFNYRWDSSTSGTPPPGHIGASVNYPLPQPPTEYTLYAHQQTDDTGDISVFWDALRVGDYMFFRESTGNLESAGMLITQVNPKVGDVYSFTGFNTGSSATEPENNRLGVVSLLANPSSRLPEGGLEDEALVKISSGNYDVDWQLPFSPYLDGYNKSGRHNSYVGDLNLIEENSKYNFEGNSVTNEPSDFGSGNWGFITTMVYTNSEQWATQVIVGMNAFNGHKQWMRDKEADVWDTWKLVVDGGAFTERLAGYDDDGVHIAFFGDLNTILHNSKYSVRDTDVTNAPAGLDDIGYITTDVRTINAVNQRMEGRNSTFGKVWVRELVSSVWSDWVLVVDGSTFPQRLAGYADTGRHEDFTGNLNDISLNSTYNFNSTVVTNAPPDFTVGWGFITTYTLSANPTGNSMQLVYQQQPQGIFKQWMRQKVSSVWSAWKLVVDGGAFTERLAGYADTGLHESYNADLNDITVNGKWVFVNANVTNQPSDFANTYGFITHDETTAGGNRATQIITGAWSGNQYKMWMRQCTNSRVWEDWKLVVDGGAFSQRLAGYTNGISQDDCPQDLDTIIWSSMYSVLGSGQGLVNDPPDYSQGGRGFIQTLLQSANYGMQYLFGRSGNNAGKIWQRDISNGVWQPWAIIVDPAGGGGGDKPVGALEFGYNPNGILSGVWTQWPEGTFLMNTVGGADPSGGSNTAVVVSHTHTIAHTHSIAHDHPNTTTSTAGNHSHAAAGNHTHSFTGYSGNNNSGGRVTTSSSSNVRGTAVTGAAGNHSHAAAGNHTHTLNVPAYSGNSGASSAANSGSAGQSGANKNKPLYKGVAVWERTA